MSNINDGFEHYEGAPTKPSPSTPVETQTTRQWFKAWFVRNNPAKWMLGTEYDRVSIMCSCLDDFLIARSTPTGQAEREKWNAENRPTYRCTGCGEEYVIGVACDLCPTPAGDTPTAQPDGLCAKCGGNGVLKIPGGITVCSACNGRCWATPTPVVEVDYEKEVDGFWKAAKKASGNNGRPTAVREWLEDFASRLRAHDLGGK